MSFFDVSSWPESSPEHLLLKMADAAIRAASPSTCIPAIVKQLFQTPPTGRTLVFGAGKASAQMAAAFEDAYHWPVEGFVVTRTGFGCETRAIQVMEASHPVPDETSNQAGHALLEAMASATENDRVIFLLSGGCSSLIFSPMPELDREQVWRFLSALIDSGLPVEAMNRLRQALSLTGGGRLAAACPGNLLTLAISDVVGDRPEDIGSAPTTHATPLAQGDLETLERHVSNAPEVLSFLRRSQPCRHPRIETSASAFHIVASSTHALQNIASLAERSGTERLIYEADVIGDVNAAALHHAEQVEVISRSGKSVLLLSGGELTVSLNPETNRSSKGGPNQEYALRLCRALYERGLSATILSIDTDGIDGRGDAAGGLISTEKYGRLLAQGVDVDCLLARSESYHALQIANALLKPGPTGTNVNDFRAVIVSGPL